jgi:hypothetical protein
MSVSTVPYHVFVEALTDSAVFQWIDGGRHPMPRAYSPEGVSLSCVMPLLFERYVKILHRLDSSYDRIDQSLSGRELEILKIPDCAIVRNLVTEKRLSSSGSRVYWKDAAQALGVPYAPGLTHAWFSRALEPDASCWPRFITGPADGALQFEECYELAALLGGITRAQACFFSLAEVPYILTDQSLLFRGMLDEVAEFFANFQFTPEYWWPPDHQWCVCSDYDLTFTIVGGTSSLISSLLKSKTLECIEISPEIRVDSFAPISAG